MPGSHRPFLGRAASLDPNEFGLGVGVRAGTDISWGTDCPGRFGPFTGGGGAVHEPKAPRPEWTTTPPTIQLLDIAVRTAIAGEPATEALITCRVDILRLARIDWPLVAVVLADLRTVPLAKRLDGGNVVRALVLA